MRFLFHPNQTTSSFLVELILIITSTILYSFSERNTKENWCLFDSFKRAQRIYAKLIDQIPIPAFVTDSSGRIMYYNESGKLLYAKTGKIYNKSLNFLDIVIQSQKKSIENLIKSAARGYVKPVEVLLLDKTPYVHSERLEESIEESAEQKQPDLNIMNIKKGML